ncbi:AhpD family alkylhydroperoxidase [Bradyrhizobium sp. GM5.1]
MATAAEQNRSWSMKMAKRLDYDRIAPAGMKALGGVYGYVMQSNLPATLVTLVYLRISQINNCAYCLDMHTRDLLKSGQKIRKDRAGAGLGGRRSSLRRAGACRPRMG